MSPTGRLATVGAGIVVLQVLQYLASLVGNISNPLFTTGSFINPEGLLSLASNLTTAVIGGLLLIVMILLLTLQESMRSMSEWGIISLAIGGTSNLLDRIGGGGVNDVFLIIATGLTFNIADAVLAIGAILLLMSLGDQSLAINVEQAEAKVIPKNK